MHGEMDSCKSKQNKSASSVKTSLVVCFPESVYVLSKPATTN